MKIHCLQHVDFEQPAFIHEWASSKNAKITFTHLYANEKLPNVDELDMLVIMGGPMSVNDEGEFNWLSDEKKFIYEAIKRNKKVLGVCLGSQLIASVLGTPVYKNKYKEIGFFPIIKKSHHQLIYDFPETSIAFHWHGETYDLPAGAELLFSSEACANQAFIYNKNVLGLQFHIEVTETLIDTWFNNETKLDSGLFIQPKEEIFKGKVYIPTCNLLMSDLLDKFVISQ